MIGQGKKLDLQDTREEIVHMKEHTTWREAAGERGRGLVT